MKIALLPGGFKPPHLGHYNMAKYLADSADEVIVRIGRKERDGIGPELALEIWNYYKAADPDNRAQQLTISIASHPSPVRDVYDFVEKIAPEGSELILGMGEKDISDGRYNSIPKFAEPRNIKAEIELVPPQAGGISGTRMREIIKSNNKEEFFKYIPDFLPEEIKEEIWTKLVDTTMPSEVEERIAFKPDISLGDVEFLDAQADADMEPLDIDLSGRHFFQRLNDPRNYPNIELDELELFFAKLADKKDEFIQFLTKYKSLVAKDNQTNINIPFMKRANRAIAKTIMRKRDFKTNKSSPIFSLEEFMGGTMNREEMAKHMANMKKLRKFFSKQGDQMTQIPTNLTKGLRRKLFMEGSKYDEATLKIQRLIFNEFKDQLGIPYKNKEWSEYWLEGPEYVVFFDIGVKFIPKKGYLIPYSVEGDAGEDDIQVKITYNPEAFQGENPQFNDLNAEIKETVRHELEHVAQYNFPNKESFEKFKGSIPFYKYLTLNHETPAFVRGLNKRAKFKGITLSAAFEEFFDDYIDQFKSPDEIQTVKNIWTDFARRNLPGVKLDEGDIYEKMAAKEKTKRMRKERLFSQDWWLDLITEEILYEGGAAGHMAHPFDLPDVNTGKDLINSFKEAAASLKKAPGSVKIDGVNASIRLINIDGKRQFAMDRGSKKALDLKGVTKADLEDRFGPGHGMIKAGGDVLDIFNDSLPKIEQELKELGLWDDPNIMFNMEYVSGKSNVQDYGKNFLAIHGLLNVETKEVQGARKMLTKRITTEKPYDKTDLENLIKKLTPAAKENGFEIYGSVPTVFKKEPDFNKALNTRYTIDSSEGDETKTLAQWLDGVTDIPKTDRLKMNLEIGGTKDVGALSKQVYFAVFGGENIDDLFDTEEEKQKAIQGATTYLATEKLGDAILDVLDSPMGSVNDHEGVVIRDRNIYSKPFKVTGKFITGGVSSDFQKK